MRMGQAVVEPTEIPSMAEAGIRIGLVPLTEQESQQGLVAAAALDVPDNYAGINARNRLAAQCDVWNASRLIEDPSQKIWQSVEQMVEELQPSDIDFLFDKLTLLQDFASPAFDKLSDKQVDDLKKAFVELDWKGLSGRPANALAMCISILLPELLQGSNSSTGSTFSSMQTNESEESTPAALPS